MIIAARWERRHAEAFAEAVGRGSGVESGRDLEQDVVVLVRLAETLRETGAEAPRAEFTRSLRERLMHEARSGPARPARPAEPTDHAFEPRRRLGAAAAAFVATSASIGVVTQSVQALPGDALYPIKRSVENARAALAQDPTAEGSSHLETARTRLDEVAALASEGEGLREAAITSRTLDDFTAQVEQAAASLFASYTDGGNRAAVEEVTAFTHSSRAALEALADDLPESAAASVAAAMETLRDLGARAQGLCNGCAVPSFASLAVSLTSPLLGRTPDAGPEPEPQTPVRSPDDSAQLKSSAGKDDAEAPADETPASGTKPKSPPPAGSEPSRLPDGSTTVDEVTELVGDLLDLDGDPGPDPRE